MDTASPGGKGAGDYAGPKPGHAGGVLAPGPHSEEWGEGAPSFAYPPGILRLRCTRWRDRNAGRPQYAAERY